MCPQVCAETRRLRDAPGGLAHYPRSSLFLADFARGRLVYQHPRRPGEVIETDLGPDHPAEALAQITGKANRALDLLTHLRDLGARWALANMMDATPFAPELYFGHAANIVQYNRRRGERSAVLWRLPGYFEPGPKLGALPSALPRDEIAFADKRPVVHWRGAASATRWRTPFQPEEGGLPLTEAALQALEGRSPRAAAVLYGRANGDFTDFRYAVPRRQRLSMGDASLRTGFSEKFQSVDLILTHRYILCLPGHDVASQLYWVIGSQSVAFVVESDYEVLPDYFLKPWVHYVPVARNLSDLREKFDFCQSRPDFCAALVDRANAAYATIQDAPRWAEAERIVLDRLGLLAD